MLCYGGIFNGHLLSVDLCVCLYLSITNWSSVKTAKHFVMQTTLHGGLWTLVFYAKDLDYIQMETARTWVASTCEVVKICSFWMTVCKMVRPCYRTVVCLVLSVCDVGALWPNDWMDQDETLRAVRPRLWLYCVRWGRSSHPPKGHSPPIFGRYMLWPNGWMD